MGKEAVQFLVDEGLVDTVAEAVEKGQQLMSNGVCAAKYPCDQSSCC